MPTVILISTAHSEIGKCNSDELYRIIESISPEVIFEELPNNLFDSFYNGNLTSDVPLEVKCIKKYIKNQAIKHIPVDIEVSQNLSTNEINYMFGIFKKYDVYKKLENQQELLIAQGGFAYLNSEKCSELFNKIKTAERQIIAFSGLNKNELIRIHNLFHKEQDNRENAMLQNIYNYSKENPYNQAVFLIGAAHRNSVVKKINEYETKEMPKINWTFYNETY